MSDIIKNEGEFKQFNLPEEIIADGALVNSQGDTLVGRGSLKSPNYAPGISGYKLDPLGNAEFQGGIFNGEFNIGGTSITIDNTDIIQEKLDEIEAAGGGTLFLQPGTYTLTSDIEMPSGVTLEGVSRDAVIIDCNSSYALKIVGTNVYTTGTVTISNGDTEVVGSGTTFTAAMVGRYIFLDGLWYEITAFTDATHIDIDTFLGADLSGSTYAIADTNFSAYIKNLTVTGATNSGIIIQYAMEPLLRNVVTHTNGIGIEMDYVTFPIIDVVTANDNGVGLNMNAVEGFYIDYSEFSFSTTGAGVVMTNQSRNATFFNTTVADNTGDGINATDASKIAFVSNDISGNGGQGVEFVSGCNDNSIMGCTFDSNVSDGFKFTATSDRNSIVACSVLNNGGYGINIAASTCDSNRVIAPAFENNTSGNVGDSGTNTVILPVNVEVVAAEDIAQGDAVCSVTANTHCIDLEASSSQYLSKTDTAPLSLTGNFTIEFWIKPESIPGADADRPAIISKWLTTGDQRSYLIELQTSGDLRITLNSTGAAGQTKAYVSSTGLSTGTWYHIAIVYTASTGTVETFKNGSSVDSDSSFSSSIFNSTADFMIGNFSGSSFYFDGMIDDVRVWSTTKTATQIAATMSVELIGNESNLVGYWKLNNALTDSTSNGATLTNNGSAVFSTDSAFTPRTAGNNIKKASAAVAALSNSFLGFASGAISSGESGNLSVNGVISSGVGTLVPGVLYYLSDTAGDISDSAGTVTRKVGIALSTTSLLITNIW